MPTPSGHTRVIAASKVEGTPVYGLNGDKIGSVEDVYLDKMSDRILFAAVGFGGFLGIGEKYHPMPWSVLNFDEQKGGYSVPYSKDELQAAPNVTLEELERDDGAIREQAFTYYKVDPNLH